MKAHVQPLEFADRIGCKGLVIAPLAPRVDELSELRAPVADVVIRNHPVAQKRTHASHRIADDRRADVADVHALRDVGRGVVDDYYRLVHLGNFEPPRGEHAGQQLTQVGIAQPQAKEARPRDLGRLDARIGSSLHGLDQQCRDVSRRAAQNPSKLHGSGALVVAGEACLAAIDAQSWQLLARGQHTAHCRLDPVSEGLV